MKPRRLLSLARTRQSGFTIIEMMVAITIGLIVLLGVSVMFVNIKQTFISQDKLAQLQDNERLAMTILTAAGQEAGYYPNAVSATSDQIVLTTDTTYGGMAKGLAVSGTAVSPTQDSLSLAFAAAATDGLITCQGATLTPSAGSVGVRNIFFVNTANNTLSCKVLVNNLTTNPGGGDVQPLVTNVQSMQVLYGVMSPGSGPVTGYWPAAYVVDWRLVKSIRLTLNFIDPNGSATPIPWVHTINLMNQ